ncbi:MAG: helix-turn-helix transcriptional regulator [Clostridia bacterium]|nr:helix-turn-helix transcriptional regulator [Clostridia bacterium]
MTTGNKLAKLRKENNITQEQLAELLGVSRQAISKWESDTAYPETVKLIRMGEIFGCSMDYLLKESMETDAPVTQEVAASWQPLLRHVFRERKSERTLLGMPLWHIGRNAHGVFAVGLHARGLVAVGLTARGLLSVGALSLGLLSFGMLSLGALAFGLLAIGLLAAGCISVGVISAGAISLGVVSMGALAGGEVAVGAYAVGHYAAIGDSARAMVAIGKTEATGSVFQHVGELIPEAAALAREELEAILPGWLKWTTSFIQSVKIR